MIGDALLKPLDVFLAQVPYSAIVGCGLDSKRSPAFTWTIRTTFDRGERRKVGLLRVSMVSDVLPCPVSWPFYASKHPDFKLLPSVFRQQKAPGPQHARGLCLYVVESHLPVLVAIAIDTEQEEINHPPVALNDWLQLCPVERAFDPAEIRVCKDLD